MSQEKTRRQSGSPASTDGRSTKKAQRESADNDTERAAKNAGKDAERAQKKADKDAERAQKKADKDAERAQKRASKEAERAQKKAERERKKSERTEHSGKPKNERVIHTRVPESLDKELRDRASALGMSVSNLVRNALNHTFGLVGDMITDSSDVARAVKGEGAPASEAPQAASTPAPAPAPTVFGWQSCRLALNALCERCNAILPKGTEAAVAVTNFPSPRPQAICLVCLDKELAQ